MPEWEHLIVEMDERERVRKVNGWPPTGIKESKRENYSHYIKQLASEGWEVFSRVFGETGPSKTVYVKSAALRRAKAND